MTDIEDEFGDIRGYGLNSSPENTIEIIIGKLKEREFCDGIGWKTEIVPGLTIVNLVEAMLHARNWWGTDQPKGLRPQRWV